MNIQVLPLSDIQSFAFQKCVLPRELFPKGASPGALAKCRVSSGIEYICNIFPMTNQYELNFCWMDDTVKVGSTKNTNKASLTSLELLNPNVMPAESVELTFFLTEKLFDIKPEPNREFLATLAKGLLMPFTLIDKGIICLEEFRSLGVAEVHVYGSTECSNVFSIGHDTKVVVSNVRLQMECGNYTPQNLIGMGSSQEELQQLLQSATFIRSLKWRVKPSLNALVIGPSGCGKTSMCLNFIMENNCNSYIIRMSRLFGQFPGEVEMQLRKMFLAVKRFVDCFSPKDPMVILIEDLEILCPAEKNTANDSGNTTRVCSQLIALLDDIYSIKESSKILVVATTTDLDAINPALRRPGRFAFEIHIPTLNEEQRGAIFRAMVEETFYGNSVDLTESMIKMVSKRTQGYVAADLALLVHTISQDCLRSESALEEFMQILEKNLKVMKPAAFYGSSVMVCKTEEKFDSIGGMCRVKGILESAVLAGLRQKAAFSRFGLCLPKGVLLYGPPGCAKTTFAKCLAAEAEMTFISTSAAEVYSPYVGNSEKFISKIFDTARKNTPCLIFLDEIDSLVGKRTANSKSDVHTRILSTLLTEMDGIEVKLFSSKGNNNILVVAATNRPDMIDDALLRPGRFDKLIHVPPPDFNSRRQILKMHARKMPFSTDVSIPEIAKATEDFSGADICNLCNEAAMHAFTKSMKADRIRMSDFLSVLRHLKSSLTRQQIKWFRDFENMHRK